MANSSGSEPLDRAAVEKELAKLIANSNVDVRDILDMTHAMAEIIDRSGWGKVEISIQAGEIDEIIISHRRKPKVERRTGNRL